MAIFDCISWVFLLLCLSFSPSISSWRLSRVGNYEIRPPLHEYTQKLENKVNSLGGYKNWKWKGNNVKYLNLGNTKESPHKSPLLLIHGAAASSFHWRNNLPVLAEKYNVYALDLLGLGVSDKPLAGISPYGTELWTGQVLDFIQEVISTSKNPLPCVVAGTCIGGQVALAAAASQISKGNHLINGCVLLNAHVRFTTPRIVERPLPPRVAGDASFTHAFLVLMKELCTTPSLLWTQLPEVLYRVTPSCVDDELVESIRQHLGTPEGRIVIHRLLESVGSYSPLSMTDEILAALTVPLLLIWGTQDAWVHPQVADRIQLLYPQAQRVDVETGHSPHDEAPERVNAAIDTFVQEVLAMGKKKKKADQL